MAGWVWDTFNTTEKMSTYLVAMIVGNYAFEESSIKLPGNKTVRVGNFILMVMPAVNMLDTLK